MLRTIIAQHPLQCVIKWGQPCYTLQASNVLILGSFKTCCTLSFFKGALIHDPHLILQKAGENTQSARILRFTSCAEIMAIEKTIQDFIRQAILIEEQGLKVKVNTEEKTLIPFELASKLKESPELNASFFALTPGRQRAYLIYFSAPKQSETKVGRIEKMIPRILSGKGIDDCICGLSKRMPRCDGSHKFSTNFQV